MRIYCAGPYETGAETREDLLRNVERGVQAFNDVWDLGHTPVLPHLSHYVEELSPVKRSWDEWMAFCLAILSGCDALYRFDAHRPCTGADRWEIPAMHSLGRPVYMALSEIPARSVLFDPI